MTISSILLDLGSDTILCFLKNYLKASIPILTNVHEFSSDVANLLHDYGYDPNVEGQKEKSVKVTLVYKNNNKFDAHAAQIIFIKINKTIMLF